MNWTWLVGSYHDQVVQPGKQPVLLLLIGLVGGFVFIRTSTRLIRAQVKWWPGNVSAGGIHLHHEVFGVLLMLISGIVGFGVNTDWPWRDTLALLFGIGAGLVLDEFALLLRLQDVYWTKEGRSSIDAVIVTVLLTLMLLVRAVPFGLRDVSDGETSARWLVVGIVAVNLLLTLVTALKGKFWLALLSTTVVVTGVVGAFRIATPTSPWARWRYGPKEMERAAERAAPWTRRKQKVISLISGLRPAPAADPAGKHQAAPANSPSSPPA